MSNTEMLRNIAVMPEDLMRYAVDPIYLTKDGGLTKVENAIRSFTVKNGEVTSIDYQLINAQGAPKYAQLIPSNPDHARSLEGLVTLFNPSRQSFRVNAQDTYTKISPLPGLIDRTNYTGRRFHLNEPLVDSIDSFAEDYDSVGEIVAYNDTTGIILIKQTSGNADYYTSIPVTQLINYGRLIPTEDERKASAESSIRIESPVQPQLPEGVKMSGVLDLMNTLGSNISLRLAGMQAKLNLTTDEYINFTAEIVNNLTANNGSLNLWQLSPQNLRRILLWAVQDRATTRMNDATFDLIMSLMLLNHLEMEAIINYAIHMRGELHYISAIEEAVFDERETVVEIEDKKVIRVEYPKKNAKDGNEITIVEVGERDTTIDATLKEIDRLVREFDTNGETDIEQQMNDLMMIINSKIARLLPAKKELELAENQWAILENWDHLKEILELGSRSFTDYIAERVFERIMDKLTEIFILALEKAGRKDFTLAVKLSYQGAGKGTFNKTSKNMVGFIEQMDLHPSLRSFFGDTLRTDLAETRTGTTGFAVPNDGDPEYAHTAPLARTTWNEVRKLGGMVSDIPMACQVIHKMIIDVLNGYSGVEIDTFPRTIGQYHIVNGLKAKLEKRGYELKTVYQIYEMADETETQFIDENREAASFAAKILGNGLVDMTKNFAATFPDTDPNIFNYLTRINFTNGSYTTTEQVITAINSIKSKLEKHEELTTEEIELQNALKPVLNDYYVNFSKDFAQNLTSDETIGKLINDETIAKIDKNAKPDKDAVIRIYKAHVAGIAKIVGQRIAGRYVREFREDDEILTSLINRFRSTEQAYGDFVNGVVQEIIPVDGEPEQAWELMINARLESTNRELYNFVTGKTDTFGGLGTAELAQIKQQWTTILETGKKEHSYSINPKLRPEA